MDKPRRLEMTGELVIWEQEGGYADASVLIDQQSVGDTLAKLCVEQWSDTKPPYFHGEWRGGRVRLLVEFEDE